MATKTVLNSNSTHGISILIDQAQQQQQQQVACGQQLSHATSKRNISPAATTTYAASTISTTSSAYSSLGSSSNDMPSAMATTSNNNNFTTTFIDINCNDEDADNIQNFGFDCEPKISTATTFPQSLLRVTTATEISYGSNNNDTDATITSTQLSEVRKTKVDEVIGEEKPKNGQRVHVVSTHGVGAADNAVGISITSEHRHSNHINNQHHTSGQQVKLVDNEVVTTSQPTTTTIIECNSIQVAVPVNDVNVAVQQKLAHLGHRNAEQHVQRNGDHHAQNDNKEAHNELVESCLGAHVSVSEHTVFAVTGTNGIAPVSVGIGSDIASNSPAAKAKSLSHWQPEQLEDVVETADCASALTESVEASVVKDSHVVKIKISPNNNSNDNKSAVETLSKINKENENLKRFPNFISAENNSEITKTVNVVQLQKSASGAHSLPKIDNYLSKTENLRLKINSEMVQKPSTTAGPTVTSASTSSGNTTVTELNVSNASSYLFYMMSSGQFSPCDTLDSGTGSDLESNGNHNGNHSNSSPPPKLSPKLVAGMNGSATNKLELHLKTTKLRVHGMAAEKKHHHRPLEADAAGDHQRAGSLTDSEESESSLSCDSLNSSDYLRHSPAQEHMVPKPPPAPTGVPPCKAHGSFLPDSLLRDIRDRKFPTNDFVSKYVVDNNNSTIYDTIEESMDMLNNGGAAVDSDQESLASHVKYVRERNSTNTPTMQRGSLPNKTFIINATDGTFVDTKMNSMPRKYEEDKYYDFHVNEHDNFRSFSLGGGSEMGDTCSEAGSWMDYEPKSQHEDAFAGYKDIRCSSGASTIRSSKGTVRGVKNRVRNGIATFLQLQQPNVKNFKEKDLGKVVLYTTSMGIIRDTYAKCSNVKQILRTLLVKFEERDVFMSVEYQQEIKERMHSESIKVPQLFVEGQHIGDAETVERLNESGELRQLLKPYKSIATTYTCQTCGGYRLLPCPSCNGSKKSVHRNHFTAEFVALKCMNCDEVGLVKCHNC